MYEYVCDGSLSSYKSIQLFDQINYLSSELTCSLNAVVMQIVCVPVSRIDSLQTFQEILHTGSYIFLMVRGPL